MHGGVHFASMRYFKKAPVIWLTALTIFFSCSENRISDDEGKSRLQEFDIQDSNNSEVKYNEDSVWIVDLEKHGEPTLPTASEIFTEREYIFLETPEDEIIGEISKIINFGNNLLILDRSISKKVFLFDNEGNFIHVVGKIGSGPGEYQDPKDVEYRNGLIFITDRQFTIHAYDVDNIFMGNFNLPFYASSSYIFKNGHFAFSNSSMGEPEVNFHLIFIDNKKITERLFEFKFVTLSKFTSSPISSNQLFHKNSFLFFKPFGNEIYEVGQSSVDLRFRLTSDDLLTDEVFEDTNNFYKRSFDYSWIYQYPILETDSIVQIRANHGGLITILINKYDRSISTYSGMKDDLLFGGIEDFPIHANGSEFYTALNVERLYQIKKEFNKERKKANNHELVANFKKNKPELYRLLESVEEFSNPILMKCKIR